MDSTLRKCRVCGEAKPLSEFRIQVGRWHAGQCNPCFKALRHAYYLRTYEKRPKRPPAIERFWPKVQKTDGCWIWTASVNPFGYGKFFDGHVLIAAHRFSWIHHYGPIPKGLFVLHHCDNRPCVRPDHLFLGTQKDNMRDMHRKGRNARNIARRVTGEKHHNAKVSDAVVLEIRRRYWAGGITQRELAAEYGISPSQVGFIARCQSRIFD